MSKSSVVEQVDVVRSGYNCDSCGKWMPCMNWDTTKPVEVKVANPQRGDDCEGYRFDVSEHRFDGLVVAVYDASTSGGARDEWHVCDNCGGAVEDAILGALKR